MRSQYNFSKMKKTKSKSWKNPRNYSLVRWTLSEKFGSTYDKCYPFKQGKNYLFVSEMPQMPGHCIVMDAGANVGKPLLYIGYHTTDFEEISKEDL